MVGRSACGQGADVVAVKEAARLCCRCSSQVCSVVLVVVVDVFFLCVFLFSVCGLFIQHDLVALINYTWY